MAAVVCTAAQELIVALEGFDTWEADCVVAEAAEEAFVVVALDGVVVVAAVAFWERIGLGAVESTDRTGSVDIRQDFGRLERLSLY